MYNHLYLKKKKNIIQDCFYTLAHQHNILPNKGTHKKFIDESWKSHCFNSEWVLFLLSKSIFCMYLSLSLPFLSFIRVISWLPIIRQLPLLDWATSSFLGEFHQVILGDQTYLWIYISLSQTSRRTCLILADGLKIWMKNHKFTYPWLCIIHFAWSYMIHNATSPSTNFLSFLTTIFFKISLWETFYIINTLYNE